MDERECRLVCSMSLMGHMTDIRDFDSEKFPVSGMFERGIFADEEKERLFGAEAVGETLKIPPEARCECTLTEILHAKIDGATWKVHPRKTHKLKLDPLNSCGMCMLQCMKKDRHWHLDGLSTAARFFVGKLAEMVVNVIDTEFVTGSMKKDTTMSDVMEKMEKRLSITFGGWELWDEICMSQFNPEHALMPALRPAPCFVVWQVCRHLWTDMESSADASDWIFASERSSGVLRMQHCFMTFQEFLRGHECFHRMEKFWEPELDSRHVVPMWHEHETKTVDDLEEWPLPKEMLKHHKAQEQHGQLWSRKTVCEDGHWENRCSEESAQEFCLLTDTEFVGEPVATADEGCKSPQHD